MNADRLKQGETYNFSNYDETMNAEVYYSDGLGKFLVELNGVMFAAEKTYSAMLRKFNSIKAKHELRNA